MPTNIDKMIDFVESRILNKDYETELNDPIKLGQISVVKLGLDEIGQEIDKKLETI